MNKKSKKKSTITGWMILNSAVIIFILGLFVSFIIFIVNLDKNIALMQQSIDTLTEEVSGLGDKYDNMNGKVARLEGAMSESVQLDSSDVLYLYPTDEFVQVLDSYQHPEYMGNNQKIDVGTIGTDKEGKDYKLDEINGRRVLFPYIENGQEVYFLGQFNENGQWDGNCIINVYNNKKLVIITNALFSDGELGRYQQVISDEKDLQDIWIVADRTRQIDKKGKIYNTGETWIYTCDVEYEQKFEFEDVTVDDLFYEGKLVSEIMAMDAKLESYYKGNTSGGLYNDDTGDAYIIKYDENRKIRTLYQGKFVNGQFEDKDAWEIARNPKTDAGYVYNVGEFSGNHFQGKEPLEINLTQERIDQIIKENDTIIDFKYLQWYKP